VRRLQLRLDPTPDAPGEARRAVRQALCERAPSLVEDAQLLVSELVTNSVRHAGLGRLDRVELILGEGDGCVRAEVLDPGPGFTFEPREPEASDEGGWGLFLVRRIASRWGVDRPDGTSRVWFELEF
jgi:anti-sigma regulatory factor (Ser/Thr protein kinase)